MLRFVKTISEANQLNDSASQNLSDDQLSAEFDDFLTKWDLSDNGSTQASKDLPYENAGFVWPNDENAASHTEDTATIPGEEQTTIFDTGNVWVDENYIAPIPQSGEGDRFYTTSSEAALDQSQTLNDESGSEHFKSFDSDDETVGEVDGKQDVTNLSESFTTTIKSAVNESAVKVAASITNAVNDSYDQVTTAIGKAVSDISEKDKSVTVAAAPRVYIPKPTTIRSEFHPQHILSEADIRLKGATIQKAQEEAKANPEREAFINSLANYGKKDDNEEPLTEVELTEDGDVPGGSINPQENEEPSIEVPSSDEDLFIANLKHLKKTINEYRRKANSCPAEILLAADKVHDALLDEYTEYDAKTADIKEEMKKQGINNFNAFIHAVDEKHDCYFVSRYPREYQKRMKKPHYPDELNEANDLISQVSKLVTNFSQCNKAEYMTILSTLSAKYIDQTNNVTELNNGYNTTLPGHFSKNQIITAAVLGFVAAVFLAASIAAIVLSCGAATPAFAALATYFGYSLFTGLAAAIGVETVIVASAATVISAAAIAGCVTLGIFGLQRGVANAAANAAEVAMDVRKREYPEEFRIAPTA